MMRCLNCGYGVSSSGLGGCYCSPQQTKRRYTLFESTHMNWIHKPGYKCPCGVTFEGWSSNLLSKDELIKALRNDFPIVKKDYCLMIGLKVVFPDGTEDFYSTLEELEASIE